MRSVPRQLASLPCGGQIVSCRVFSRLSDRFVFALSVLAFVSLGPASARGAESDSPSQPYSVQWQEAIDAYQAKDFVRARDSFERMAREGHSSADLFFNLGNAYYQLGEKGLAAWMWEKTLTLAPRHADARHNLRIVRPANGGSEPQAFFMFWPVVWLWRRYTAAEWALALGALQAVAALAAIGWILLREGRARRLVRAACLTGIGAAVVCAAFFFPRLAQAEWRRYGVVVEDGAVVRSAPGPEEPEYFEAPICERLEISEAPVQGWLRVKRPSDGRVGFLPEANVRGL